MSGIHSLRDLLIPNGQDTRCFVNVKKADQRQRQSVSAKTLAKTSSFCPSLWKPKRLPLFAQLHSDLQTKMFEDLATILDHSYPDQAARTSFTDSIGRNVTPRDMLLTLRAQCSHAPFRLNYEGGPTALSDYLAHLVSEIYYGLTGNMSTYEIQERSSSNQVITDFSYQVHDRLKVLWEVKSPLVFDYFMGELIDKVKDGLPAKLCIKSEPTTYRGYESILANLGYHALDIRPRVRWAIVFSGVRYIIIYIPRTQGRPTIFCSPILHFCLQPGEEGPLSRQPPIWSILVYMLLVEALDVSDGTLRKRLGVAIPSRILSSSVLESNLDAGPRYSKLEMIEERGKSQTPSGTLTEAPENLTVQCVDACPIELSLINPPRSHHAMKEYHPFVHLDCHFGAGWSTVFASSRSRIVVKFDKVPKKDRAELIRQLRNEKLAYNKLNCISGWIVPRLYGEYEWYGGRALVLSKEGQSLSDLGDFTSLSLIERLILFAEVCCMHYLGVEHRDLEPRNVLRKRWSCIFKIIDFGFSDVNHTCPGWGQCYELKEMWHRLQLDRPNF